MSRFLIIRVDAPLISFGGTIVDNRGFADRFPALSMVTGLLGNALGYDRNETERLQRLQDRLVLASRIEGNAEHLRDFQTAKLEKNDKAWTTRGIVEGRDGGANTYDSPHIRYRDFWTGITVTLAVGLDPANETPTLDDCAQALVHPQRPLFVGRKPCLPSRPLIVGDPFVEAPDIRTALQSTPMTRPLAKGDLLAYQWPAPPGAESTPSFRLESVTDQRLWISGPHAGTRRVFVSEERHG
jgi:CRISPR system Cascade subunit CasD